MDARFFAVVRGLEKKDANADLQLQEALKVDNPKKCALLLSLMQTQAKEICYLQESLSEAFAKNGLRSYLFPSLLCQKASHRVITLAEHCLQLSIQNKPKL